MSFNRVPAITVSELKGKIDGNESFVLVDVREPSEVEICQLPSSIKIPLGSISARVQELDPNAETIVHCKAGVRSAKAVKFLLDQGFTNVKNLTGGIDSWAKEIEPGMKRY